jgi:hypothetical protein
MSFSFRPARREGVPLLIGLAGASGSGKTFSALSLAQGIASVTGGKIAFIDTENRRGLHYADRFEFMHAEIAPPFSPARYGEAIKAAEDAQVAVVVIDSFSHEYEGEGGILDWAAKKRRAARSRRRNGSSRSPRTRRWSIRCSAPGRTSSFACARKRRCSCSKSRSSSATAVRMWQGKPQFITEVIAAADRPLNERWHPICEKRFPYEITTSLLLLPGNPGVPVPLKLQEQHKGAFPAGQPITAEAGRFLAAWAKGDAVNAGTSESLPPAKQTAEQWTDQYVSDVADCATIDDLMALQASSAKALAKLQTDKPELHERAVSAGAKRAAELQGDSRMKTCTVHFTGQAPYSASRAHCAEKLPKETPDAYEERTWREKAHVKDGRVVIPAMAFKIGLDRAAKMLGRQIPGKGKATYTKFSKAASSSLRTCRLPTKAGLRKSAFTLTRTECADRASEFGAASPASTNGKARSASTSSRMRSRRTFSRKPPNMLASPWASVGFGPSAVVSLAATPSANLNGLNCEHPCASRLYAPRHSASQRFAPLLFAPPRNATNSFTSQGVINVQHQT